MNILQGRAMGYIDKLIGGIEDKIQFNIMYFFSHKAFYNKILKIFYCPLLFFFLISLVLSSEIVWNFEDGDISNWVAGHHGEMDTKKLHSETMDDSSHSFHIGKNAGDTFESRRGSAVLDIPNVKADDFPYLSFQMRLGAYCHGRVLIGLITTDGETIWFGWADDGGNVYNSMRYKRYWNTYIISHANAEISSTKGKTIDKIIIFTESTATDSAYLLIDNIELLDGVACNQINPIERAKCHSEYANQILSASSRYLDAWLTYGIDNYGDNETALFSTFIDTDSLKPSHYQFWIPNAAADNYPFLILAAYFTDNQEYMDLLKQTKIDMEKYCTRVGNLLDEYNFKDEHFLFATPNIHSIIFGNSEYTKDGMVAITDRIFDPDLRPIWYEQMKKIEDDIMKYAPVKTDYGNIPSAGTEVNGEMLQTLVRLYHMTGNSKYMEWAEQIGDVYFFEILPDNEYSLPCMDWDFANHVCKTEVLHLMNHGDEIVDGLTKLYIAELEYNKNKADLYYPRLKKMLNSLLDYAMNEDGMSYLEINIMNLSIPENAYISQNWGDKYYAFYSFCKATGELEFCAKAENAVKKIYKYDWGSSAARSEPNADALENGIVFLNIYPEISHLRDWIFMRTQNILDNQNSNGLWGLGGNPQAWYGEGNIIRSILLFEDYLAQGLRISDWRDDIKIGSAQTDDGSLYTYISALNPYSGKIIFDSKRHEKMGIDKDYPYINTWPEWFTIDENREYEITDLDSNTTTIHNGSELVSTGYDVRLATGQEKKIKVEIVQVNCNLDGTDFTGKCNEVCSASQWCNGLTPLTVIPYCAKRGNTAIHDRCSSNCQPEDSPDMTCRKSGVSDCTGDSACDLIVAGDCSLNLLKKCNFNCEEISSCGDGICNCGENSANCPEDCCIPVGQSCSLNTECCSNICNQNCCSETCPADNWYNSNNTYSCCNGDNKCTCQDQEYRDYYCNFSGDCDYSITNTQTVKSNCNSCGTDGCSGNNYIDYYCSNGLCSHSSDDCSDCSCSCGNYNQLESNFCSDGKDNDCDGKTDRLDCDCGVSISSISVSDTNPVENMYIKVDCDSSVAYVNCIGAGIGENNCTFINRTGNKSRFNCNVGPAGSRTARCFVQTDKCCALPPLEKTVQINVKPTVCSGYTNLTSCNTESVCEWCPKCSGNKYNSLGDKCVNKGSCAYNCKNWFCGATCDSSVGCPRFCSGNTSYYNGTCENNCSCSYSSQDCNNLNGWYCNENIRENRNYYCDNGNCIYNITYSENCNNYDYYDNCLLSCSDTITKYCYRTSHNFYCSEGICRQDISDASYSMVCNTNQYCFQGNCFNCSNVCDGLCESPVCYNLDLDCDKNGFATNKCCGNKICEINENYNSCPNDCPHILTCGNGICEKNETCSNCQDCSCSENQICCGNTCKEKTECGECYYSCCLENKITCCKEIDCKTTIVDRQRQEAEEAIQKVGLVINESRQRGVDTKKAEDILSEAKEAYQQGNYLKAKQLAEEVYQVVGVSGKPFPVSLIAVFAGVVISIVILSVALGRG